jgi:hypothetical protein
MNEKQCERDRSKMDFAKGSARNGILRKGRKSLPGFRRASKGSAPVDITTVDVEGAPGADVGAGAPGAGATDGAAAPPAAPSTEVEQQAVARNASAVAVARTLQELPGSARDAVGELSSLCAALRVQRTELKERVLTNYAMTADVAELDLKIRLLVQKRATISEVMSSRGAAHLLGGAAAAGGAGGADGEDGAFMMTHDLKASYGALFHYLQTRPLYLARLLGRLQKSADIELFTRVVVYNLFGDQFETREERRLLALLQGALKREFSASGGEMGAFMRANSAVTQTLLAYARRPAAMAALEDMLAPLLAEVLAPDAMPLELKPHAVYTSLVNAHESSTGDASPLPPPGTQTDAELAAHPAVAAVLAERVPLLLATCERLLARLEASVDALPFGIRWIARIMQQLARVTFIGASTVQVNSIVGGFVFLRYINPAIVTPDGLNLIQTRLKPSQRRSLVLVAQVLQKLSNGAVFTEKEAFLLPCNAFLDASRARIDAWFTHLTDVDEDIARDGSVEADLFLEHVHQRDNTLTLSLSEVLSIHKLVAEHSDHILHGGAAQVSGVASSTTGCTGGVISPPSSIKVALPAGADDPLGLVLVDLGPPPEKVPKSRSAADLPCMLTLEGRRALGGTAAAGGGAASGNGVLRSADGGSEGDGGDGGGGSPRRHGRSASVWDRLEQQQADQSKAEVVPVAAITRARNISVNSFTSDDADRALKESLADVLRGVPLDAALAKVLGKAADDSEDVVTLMQLLAAAHRVHEESDNAEAVAAIDDVVKRMERARDRDASAGAAAHREPKLAVLAEDDEEDEDEEEEVAAAAAGGGEVAMEKAERGEAGEVMAPRRRLTRGGSDRFMFVEEPTLHPRLLSELGASLASMAQAHVTLSARLEKLRRAASDVERHHAFLREKYAVFQQYLDAVRAKTQLEGSRRARIARGLFQRKKVTTLRRTYKQLSSSGVIVSSDVMPSYHKLLVFKFVQPAPGMFEISAGLPGLSSFTKTLLLEDLLEQQQRNNTVMSVEEVFI